MLLAALAACSEQRPEYESFVQGITQAELLGSFGAPMRTTYFYELDSGEWIWSPETQVYEDVERSNEIWFYLAQRTISVTEDREYVRKGLVRLGFEVDDVDSTPAQGKGWVNEEDIDAWFRSINL